MGTKSPRKLMKVFGASATGTQRGIFGSFAAGSPAFSGDVETIQSLPAWDIGWYAAIVGDSNPAIQDMNAMLYVFAYQIAYMLRAGIPEWNAQTEYFIGDAASDGAGNYYISVTNNSIGNALTNPTYWRNSRSALIEILNPASASPKTLAAEDSGKTFLVSTTNGAMQFTLPSPIANFRFKVKDTSGRASVNNITIVRPDGETIEGTASTYSCVSDFGVWEFVCDGSNWWLT